MDMAFTVQCLWLLCATRCALCALLHMHNHMVHQFISRRSFLTILYFSQYLFSFFIFFLALCVLLWAWLHGWQRWCVSCVFCTVYSYMFCYQLIYEDTERKEKKKNPRKTKSIIKQKKAIIKETTTNRPPPISLASIHKHTHEIRQQNAIREKKTKIWNQSEPEQAKGNREKKNWKM